VSIEELWKRLNDHLNDDDGTGCVWDLVDHVEIGMKSLLLQAGMRIIDCPGKWPSRHHELTMLTATTTGFGDTNLTRAARANEARRKADIEMPVLKAKRVQSQTLDLQEICTSITHHGSQNTVVVVTKLDVSKFPCSGELSANSSRLHPRKKSRNPSTTFFQVVRFWSHA
jgi:hypothetical protein